MPFLRLSDNITKNLTAHSLRAYLDDRQGDHNSTSLMSILRNTGKSSKRASPFAFLKRRVSASMTLEAAFVLPFFLFAVINIIFSMNILAAQSRINAALHQTGNKMAFAAYAVQDLAGGGAGGALAGVALSELYARSRIVEYAGSGFLDQSCISSGSAGLSMLGSQVMGEGDVIDLRVSYRVRPFSSLMGFEGFSMGQRYYGKAWTGYDVEKYESGGSQEDPMVYITQTGTVYHMARNCSYLNPAVRTVSGERVREERNSAGAKYYPCERCKTGSGLSIYYITEDGNRYHGDLNCSGLRRTIYTVPLSQVSGRGRCSKCG